MDYLSLERNQINLNNMTNINMTNITTPQNHITKDKCNHCESDLNQKSRVPVLNRNLCARRLEPEYYRYNKSIKIDVDDIERKYIQYKPRRPKCPIVFNHLFPHGKSPYHLIHNPLYSYPIDSSIQNIENKWMNKVVVDNKNIVNNIKYMMDDYTNAYPEE